MLNRKGKTEGMSAILWIAAILVAAYLFVPSFQTSVKGWFGGSTSTPTPGSGITDPTSCPSSGITTYTLNVQDKLASTATNVDVEYYVFNGAKLISDGVTGGDGSVSYDVACGKNYKILLINSTTGQSTGGAYGQILDLNARIAADTVNAEVVKVGGASIVRIENPLDQQRDNNITLAAGATKSFNLVFQANGTAQAYQNPLILCQANITSISNVQISSFSDGTPVKSVTPPSRVTASAGYQYRAWEYSKILETANGAVTATGTISAQASVTPSTTDSMTCRIVDQQLWKKASYKTATSPEEAFGFGAENTETLADIGGVDSSSASLNFNNADGV